MTQLFYSLSVVYRPGRDDEETSGAKACELADELGATNGKFRYFPTHDPENEFEVELHGRSARKHPIGLLVLNPLRDTDQVKRALVRSFETFDVESLRPKSYEHTGGFP